MKRFHREKTYSLAGKCNFRVLRDSDLGQSVSSHDTTGVGPFIRQEN